MSESSNSLSLEGVRRRELEGVLESRPDENLDLDWLGDELWLTNDYPCTGPFVSRRVSGDS